MLRRVWLVGVACVALLAGSSGLSRRADAQGIWFGGVGLGGPGFYGGGFGPYGVGGWGGVLPARVASPVAVSRPVVACARPAVVVAPTPHAYRHANRVVRRVWRRGW